MKMTDLKWLHYNWASWFSIFILFATLNLHYQSATSYWASFSLSWSLFFSFFYWLPSIPSAIHSMLSANRTFLGFTASFRIAGRFEENIASGVTGQYLRPVYLPPCGITMFTCWTFDSGLIISLMIPEPYLGGMSFTFITSAKHTFGMITTLSEKCTCGPKIEYAVPSFYRSTACWMMVAGWSAVEVVPTCR